MPQEHILVNDIIADHKERMLNLRKYYPFSNCLRCPSHGLRTVFMTILIWDIFLWLSARSLLRKITLKNAMLHIRCIMIYERMHQT